MKLTVDHHKELIKKLKNLDFALGYLNACLEDEDDGVFLLGLRHVAEAHGGLKKLADKAQLNREHLYRLLSKNGNPRLNSIQELAHVFGWRVLLAPEEKKYKKAA